MLVKLLKDSGSFVKDDIVEVSQTRGDWLTRHRMAVVVSEEDLLIGQGEPEEAVEEVVVENEVFQPAPVEDEEEADEEDEDGEEESEDQEEEEGRSVPAKSANKPVWIDYALATTDAFSREELEGMTKEQIISLFEEESSDG